VKRKDMQDRNIFNIPADHPFFPNFIKGLFDRFGNDPQHFADMIIVLPTRRACRSLREHFYAFVENKSIILPKMMPLGDLTGPEILSFLDQHDQSFSFEDFEAQIAMPSLKRQLILTRLLLQASEKIPSLWHAFHLATDLSTLLDQAYAEEQDFKGLKDLVPENYAAHWQEVLKFLEIITETWPEILKEEDSCDQADLRNRQFRIIEKFWNQTPPQKNIIFAGVNLALPAAADMVKAALQSASVYLVLSGLDTKMDESSWGQIEATHPQYLLKVLCERYRLEPQHIQNWCDLNQELSRANLVSEIFRPAQETPHWQHLKSKPGLIQNFSQSLEKITYIEADHQDEEAKIIALILRSFLEGYQKGHAAFVTLDRSLSKRVTQNLKRWEIEIDDSAGTMLSMTSSGVFLNLILDYLFSKDDPVKFISLLKHPLAKLGMSEDKKHALIYQLEVKYLRDKSYQGDLFKLKDIFVEEGEDDLVRLIDQILSAFYDVMDLADCETSSLALYLDRHLEAALKLSKNEQGDYCLWEQGESEEIANFFASVKAQADSYGVLSFHDYMTLVQELCAQEPIRAKYGMTERISILGPMESRLQKFDLVIMGGLNEGSWPPDVSGDPWMSRQMRAEFGLSPLEQRIGISAHDFAQLFASNEVYLTRAQKVGGSPAVASRWLERFEAILLATNLDQKWREDASKWQNWAKALHHADQTDLLAPPAPKPPISKRPRRLSVTEIEKWRRNPYQIYARHILKLKPIEPFAVINDHREKGTIFHDIFEQFIKAHPLSLPKNAEQILLEAGKKSFGELLLNPRIQTFWWGRFEKLADWFLVEQSQRLQAGIKVLGVEPKGSLILVTEAGNFELVARADRIDLLANQSYEIIDYKTGSPPPKKDVASGYAPQLLLEAIMVEKNAFQDIPSKEVTQISYWHLKGEDASIISLSEKDQLDDLKENVLQGLMDLIQKYEYEDTPYLAYPNFMVAPRYDDYRHLARVDEWYLNQNKRENMDA
jgi:ATP-dependent helicase/nuclease subunit B